MLVLSRYTGQSFMIGNNIRVMLLEIKSKERARIAIEAPEGVKVLRAELFEKSRNDSREERRQVVND